MPTSTASATPAAVAPAAGVARRRIARSCTSLPVPSAGHWHRCSWQHATMVENFRAAREAWEQQCERASNGWPTERRQFLAAHPPPRLRDYMGADGHLDHATDGHDRGDDVDQPDEDARPTRRLAS